MPSSMLNILEASLRSRYQLKLRGETGNIFHSVRTHYVVYRCEFSRSVVPVKVNNRKQKNADTSCNGETQNKHIMY